MKNKGFTLIELMISITILMIVSLGFFSWATTMISNNISMEKINIANEMALDVADRLQRLPDNPLNQAKSSNSKYVGYNSSAYLAKCTGSPPTPSGNISTDATGKTEYTDPWNNTSNQLYLYDNNACSSSNPSCFGSSVTITTSANSNIDHPNSTANPAYDYISPIRFIRNTTYYAVWSVAYMPCDSTSTNKRKIFITVYWIDPEPADTNVADVQTKIASGAYRLKSVSLTVDKVIGVES